MSQTPTPEKSTSSPAPTDAERADQVAYVASLISNLLRGISALTSDLSSMKDKIDDIGSKIIRLTDIERRVIILETRMNWMWIVIMLIIVLILFIIFILVGSFTGAHYG